MNSRSILSLHSLSTIYPSTFTTVDVCPIDISLCRHFSCRPFTLSTFLIVNISLCRHLIRRQKNLSAKNFSTKICRRYALDISLSTFGYFPSLSIHLSFFAFVRFGAVSTFLIRFTFFYCSPFCGARI
jgi:hypothetical protein